MSSGAGGASPDGRFAAMKSEVESLKAVIAKMTEEHQTKVQALNLEIEFLKMKTQDQGPTKREEELTDEVAELKSSQVQSAAKLTAEGQREISDMHFEVAELKNATARAQAENAQLTLQNLELTRGVQQLQEAADRWPEQMRFFKAAFEQGASHLIQLQMSSHTQLIKRLDKLTPKFDALIDRTAGLSTRVGSMAAKEEGFRNRADTCEKAVDYLARALVIVSDLPLMNPPTARELIEDPDALIQLVAAAESESKQEKQDLEEKLRETSKSLAQSMSLIHRPPLSQPVARALTHLGEVVIEVSEQLEEDHRDTMKLLEGVSDDDSLTDVV